MIIAYTNTLPTNVIIEHTHTTNVIIEYTRTQHQQDYRVHTDTHTTNMIIALQAQPPVLHYNPFLALIKTTLISIVIILNLVHSFATRALTHLQIQCFTFEYYFQILQTLSHNLHIQFAYLWFNTMFERSSSSFHIKVLYKYSMENSI